MQFRAQGNGRQSIAQAVEADSVFREELIGRVGRGFHVSRLDTATLARENFIPEYLVCRYLEIYRARRREKQREAP